MITLRRLKVVVLVVAISALQYFLYLGLRGSALAIAEGIPGTIPLWLRVAVSILGAPLMLLPESWLVALRSLIGDDTKTLLIVAAVNALFWGIVLVASFNFVAARRQAQSNTAPA
jgi:hypothetical protein